MKFMILSAVFFGGLAHACEPWRNCIYAEFEKAIHQIQNLPAKELENASEGLKQNLGILRTITWENACNMTYSTAIRGSHWYYVNGIDSKGRKFHAYFAAVMKTVSKTKLFPFVYPGAEDVVGGIRVTEEHECRLDTTGIPYSQAAFQITSEDIPTFKITLNSENHSWLQRRALQESYRREMYPWDRNPFGW